MSKKKVKKPFVFQKIYEYKKKRSNISKLFKIDIHNIYFIMFI